MIMDIYLIIIKKKDCKALATKNCQRRLINAKLEWEKTQNMRKWLADFCQCLISPYLEEIS
jgi:hypothetical protein